MAKATLSLKRLESLKNEFGPQAAMQKKECLQELKSAQFATAAEIERLHEILCFMQAWPDDEATLSLVDTLLAQFDQRRDLKRHAEELANTGIAGTPIHFQFFAVTARWLAERWPDRIRIDWEEFENAELLEPYLELMASYSELPGVESIAMEVSDWIDRLKGPHETDAYFVIRRLQALIPNEFLHEYLYDKFDIPLCLAAGPGVPSRTLAKYESSPIVYQTSPLLRVRPEVKEEIGRPRKSPKLVSHAEGVRLVDLARSAMVTRQRDLDAIAYADARDVSVLEDDGLQFVLYGVIPQRRFLLETLYGFVILKNGVPISYGAVTCLFRSAEVAYSILEPFRGADSARIYARTLAMIHHVFGCDTFMAVPYQLGAENDDALKSGAWWFYQKLGYRPRDKKLLKLMERELATMKRRPNHRSSLTVLRQLVTENMYLALSDPRDDVMGILELANVGLKITDLFARRFGSNRELGETTLAAEAAARLGVESFQGWSAGEQLAWRRWAPIVALLDNVDHWSATDRASLVRLIRAKGGRHELDYLREFDGHRALREAIVAMAKE